MDWKDRLKPAGILLASYFLAPALVHGFLGRYDAPFGGFAISDLLQLGLGVALIRSLWARREFLLAELDSRLSARGRPADLTQALAREIASSARVLVPSALLLPPLAALFPYGGLIVLLKLGVVLYVVYAAYAVWRVLDPFLSREDSGEAARPAPPPPPPSRRCPACGQAADYGLKTCSFCKKPL